MTTTNVATTAAAFASAITTGNGVSFAQAYAFAAVKLIEEDDKESAINCVSSVAIAISISIQEGRTEEANACADAFSQALIAQFECNVIIVEIVKVFVSIVSTTVTSSGSLVILG